MRETGGVISTIFSAFTIGLARGRGGHSVAVCPRLLQMPDWNLNRRCRCWVPELHRAPLPAFWRSGRVPIRRTNGGGGGGSDPLERLYAAGGGGVTPPPLPMFEADSQTFASAPSMPRGFSFSAEHRRALGGGRVPAKPSPPFLMHPSGGGGGLWREPRPIPPEDDVALLEAGPAATHTPHHGPPAKRLHLRFVRAVPGHWGGGGCSERHLFFVNGVHGNAAGDPFPLHRVPLGDQGLGGGGRGGGGGPWLIRVNPPNTAHSHQTRGGRGGGWH